MESISAHISPDDFISLRHVVLVRNDTSGTQVTDETLCKIEELRSDGATLVMPKNSCKEGHSLALFIFRWPLKNRLKTLPLSGSVKGAFEVIGKVLEIQKNDEHAPEESWSVSIKFTQFDEVKWKKLVGQYTAHQKKINQLIQKKRQG